MPRLRQITALLLAWNQGDQTALEKLTRWSIRSCTGWPVAIWGASAPATRCKPRHW